MANLEKIALRNMKVGQTEKGLLLILGVEVKNGKNGLPYHELILTDGEMQVVARDFNNNCQRSKGDVAYLQLHAEEFAGRTTYRIEKIASNPYNDVMDASMFVRKAPVDVHDMYDWIMEILHSVVEKSQKENCIAKIAIDLYKKNEEKLIYWSAARGMHHNFYGGLLYHVYRMMHLAQGYLVAYPTLNEELLLTAVAIHDIGKLVELETDSMGTAEYTVSGEMLGHAVIGIQMIDEIAKDGQYDEEMLMCLKHCVASHHGNLEWDAIVVPKFEEAFILHMIDLADSRVIMFENAYAGIEPGKLSAKRDLGLETNVYRPNFYNA